MTQSTHEEDAKMLLDIPSPVNDVVNDQLTLKLIDICFENMLLILCKSLLYFEKWKIDYSKVPKFGF